MIRRSKFSVISIMMVLDYLLKQNGNMLVVRDPAVISMGKLMILLGFKIIQVAAYMVSVKKLLIYGDYMIC